MILLFFEFFVEILEFPIIENLEDGQLNHTKISLSIDHSLSSGYE